MARRLLRCGTKVDVSSAHNNGAERLSTQEGLNCHDETDVCTVLGGNFASGICFAIKT